MPRVNPRLQAALPVDQLAAPEAQAEAAPAAPAAPRQLPPSKFQKLQRRAKSAVSCFGFSGTKESENLSANLSQPNKRADLHAAIDAWVQTQPSIDLSQPAHMRFCTDLKDLVAPPISKAWTIVESLNLSGIELTTVPPGLERAKYLTLVDLQHNNLSEIPIGLTRSKTLKYLLLDDNLITRIPAEVGNMKKLSSLSLCANRLSEIPDALTRLPKLSYLNLSSNHFTHVPRTVLAMPAHTQINLQDNPIPEAEIRAVRAEVAFRTRVGQRMPSVLLPPLPEDGELREAVANGMNVHTGVLRDAFAKRLDELARQFPTHLRGVPEDQRTELTAIETRLNAALSAYGARRGTDQRALERARKVAALMFQKGRGETQAYVNEFEHSAGHVLAYSFLSIEAQLAKTPSEHHAKAQPNGVAALVTALSRGTGFCDTRLCEEVMQTIGIPLSDYAENHPEIVDIKPPSISEEESRDIILPVAKEALQSLLRDNPELNGERQPAAWRETLTQTILRDHPYLPAEHLEAQLEQIESAWQMFHDLVVEQTEVK